MTKIVVMGPNLIDQSKGSFHVHAAGCCDLGTYYGAEHTADKNSVLDIDSPVEVAEYVYSDMLDDDGVSADELVNDFYFFPCVSFLKEAATMRTISYEYYHSGVGLFFEVEVQTKDVEGTLALLRSAKTTRNIKVL